MAAPRPAPAWMRPIWVRILMVLVPTVWAVAELAYGDQTWALMFGGVAVWGLWSLLIRFDPGDRA
jgi:hypothetical protein